MASAKVRVQVGRTWIEVDSASVKDAIKGIAEYAEFFCETECKLCKSPSVTPSHRLAKGYDFYEMVCLSCGAKLSFGQAKEGGRLFPKRKDQDGNEIGTQGWHRYQASEGGF